MVASTTSQSPEAPADQPQSPPLTPLADHGGQAADQATTPSSRPPLSQTDSALLSHILRHRLDLEAAALPLGLDLATLLDFTDRPDIKLRIESYQRLRLASVNDKVLDLTASTRIDAIQHLSQLIKETDNPIEKRRAIDLILRYTGPIAPTTHRTSSRTNASSTPPHPPTPSPTRSPAPSSHPTSDIPHPTFREATALATHIETLLTPEKKRPETLLPALHACFAPRALLNKHPVPTDPSAFAKAIHPDVTKLLCLPVTLIERTTKATGPNSPTESLWFIPHRGPQYILTLTLARDNAESPWQLHTLDTT